MNVRVRLFAVARQLAGQDAVDFEFSGPPSVAELRARLGQEFPQLGDVLRHVLFAVNSQYSGDEVEIPPGAEVACIPPVSGG